MYSQPQIQAIAMRTGCCASALGYRAQVLKQKGHECADDLLNVKYLVRAKKTLQCYIPVGTVVNADKANVVKLIVPYSLTSLSSGQLVIDGNVVWTQATVINSTSQMLLVIAIALNGGSTYTATTSPFLNPTQITITGPLSLYSGVSAVLTFVNNFKTQVETSSGIFFGGAYVQTAAMNCLTEPNVYHLIENINAICGCLGSSCNDYLDDVTDPAVNNTVINVLNPAGSRDLRFRFYTTLNVVTYDLSLLTTLYNWNNIQIDALDFGNSPLTSNQYTKIGSILTFNFDPSLVNQGTEVNMEMHYI